MREIEVEKREEKRLSVEEVHAVFSTVNRVKIL